MKDEMGTAMKEEMGTVIVGKEQMLLKPLTKVFFAILLTILLTLTLTANTAFACANCGAGMRPNHADRPLPTIYITEDAREVTRQGQTNPIVPVHQNWASTVIHRPGETWRNTRDRHNDLHGHREAHTQIMLLIDSNNNIVGWWFAPYQNSPLPWGHGHLGNGNGNNFRVTIP